MYIAHIRNDGTEQTCKVHCDETARLTQQCISDLGLSNTGYIAGLLHDCGKFTDDFDDYIHRASNGEKVRKGSVVHSFAAVSFFLGNYLNSQNEFAKLTAQILACADGSHHGLFDCYDKNGYSGFDHRLSKQRDYDKKAIENFYKECAQKQTVDAKFADAVKEISDHFELIKSICSETPSKRKGNDFLFFFSLLTRMITSAVVDSDRRQTASFMNDKPIPEKANTEILWKECLENLSEILSSFPQETDLQKARRELSELCATAAEKSTGIYRLDLPTGGGKTLSALRFALRHAQIHKKERVFYVSPLLSILEQNADVIRKAIGHDEMILEHHSDVINEGKTDDELNQYEYLIDSWESPIIITTLVQFLNTLFSGKMSSVRRFHSLKNSVVIIDEVQTVPGKMLTLFNLALNYFSTMCNTTFVLCSATQPELKQIPHPICPNSLLPKEVVEKYDKVFKRTAIVDKGTCKLVDVPKYITELLESHQSVLVVCNKKRESVELFSTINYPGTKVYHLSAGMCVAHRKESLFTDLCGIKQNRY